MNWYLVKIVYQIVCGSGLHTAQFDEQLRLIEAGDERLAFDKAVAIGKQEEETFYNVKDQLVRWQFVNVSELYRLSNLIDGAELYSRINEVDNAAAYITFVNQKAKGISEKSLHNLLNLI